LVRYRRFDVGLFSLAVPCALLAFRVTCQLLGLQPRFKDHKTHSTSGHRQATTSNHSSHPKPDPLAISFILG
jgi:hypothetical protein